MKRFKSWIQRPWEIAPLLGKDSNFTGNCPTITQNPFIVFDRQIYGDQKSFQIDEIWPFTSFLDFWQQSLPAII